MDGAIVAEKTENRVVTITGWMALAALGGFSLVVTVVVLLISFYFHANDPYAHMGERFRQPRDNGTTSPAHPDQFHPSPYRKNSLKVDLPPSVRYYVKGAHELEMRIEKLERNTEWAVWWIRWYHFR